MPPFGNVCVPWLGRRRPRGAADHQPTLAPDVGRINMRSWPPLGRRECYTRVVYKSAKIPNLGGQVLYVYYQQYTSFSSHKTAQFTTNPTNRIYKNQQGNCVTMLEDLHILEGVVPYGCYNRLYFVRFCYDFESGRLVGLLVSVPPPP